MNFINQLNNLIYWVYQNPWLMFLITVWVLVWKGWALWRSARKSQKYWFVALLVINTLGVLEILYLFVFSEIKRKKQKTESEPASA
ncbi:MAG: DUF5652 family protein [Patescibacteria group bacterium]